MTNQVSAAMEVAEQLQPSTALEAGTEAKSIKEAFLKAATAVKSHAASILSSGQGADSPLAADGGCVNDPHPALGDPSVDAVTGIMPECGPPGPCTTEKGRTVEVRNIDDVVAPGGSSMEDEVVVPESESEVEESQKPCVDGLQGLEIGAKGRNDNGEVEEEGDDDEQTLVGVA